MKFFLLHTLTPFFLSRLYSATGTSSSNIFFPLFLVFFTLLLFFCSPISLSLPTSFNWSVSHFFLLCMTCQILHIFFNFSSRSSITYMLRFPLAVFSPTDHSTVISPHPVKSKNYLALQSYLGLHGALRFRFMESNAVCESFVKSGKQALARDSYRLSLEQAEPGMVVMGSNGKWELSNILPSVNILTDKFCHAFTIPIN